MNKKHAFKKTLCIIAVIVATLFGSYSLTGCSFLFKILTESNATVMFTRNSITLEVGESFDLSAIIESNTDSYKLSVTPKSVATIKGTDVKGVAPGNATVTAETSSTYSTLKVVVTEADADALTVKAVGELIQTVGEASAVKFVPSASGSVRSESVEWCVNGKTEKTLQSDKTFEFTPSAAGEYSVVAKAGEFTVDAGTVRVYYPVEAAVSYVGEIVQDEAPYTAIGLTATVENNALNPEPYVSWIVDGKESEEHGTEYSFMPEAGTHTVSVKVNGVQRNIGDGTTLTVTCRGSIVPEMPNIVYDNMYPDVFITYDVAGRAAVEVTDPSGTVSVYKETDAECSELFDDGMFNAGSAIDICASGSSRGAYGIRVKSLGDGGALTESGYSTSLVFTQLPRAAQSFLKNRYFDRDFYITSDAEYVNLLEYMIISRPKYANAKVEFDCYIAYDMQSDAESLWTNAFEIAATSGLYTDNSAYIRNNVMTTSFRVDTVNAPSKQTKTRSNDSLYSKQLHAILPHINYDEEKYRPEGYKFPIDTCKNSQIVSCTDELYLAAENNTRPIPVSGSAAETVYGLARSILGKIVSDDMTDAQKAHAIYDWIMWQVTYDTPATEIDDDGESYSAYYLEGVFGDGKTAIDGVKYDPYAVCDGLSKAYSLMCNIEGVPCMRVSGLAGSSLARAGGHAWNKVCLDGEWYIVDCTWGDYTSVLTLGGVSDEYEIGSHEYLFLAEADVSETHFEPYKSGDSYIRYAPKTAAARYDVYSEMTYNGITVNCSIDEHSDTDALTQFADAVKGFAKAYRPMTSINIPGGPNDGVYEIGYQAFEIYFGQNKKPLDVQLSMTANSAVHSVIPGAEVKTYVLDSSVIVLVK